MAKPYDPDRTQFQYLFRLTDHQLKVRIVDIRGNIDV